MNALYRGSMKKMFIRSYLFITIAFILLVGCGSALYSVYQGAHKTKQDNESNEMVEDSDLELPSTKIPPISMNSNPLIQALLERVWVTKYFGTPAELFRFSDNMPLCEKMPNSDPKKEERNGIFLWQYKCLPIEIKWKVNRVDLSGTALVRMLDFGESVEVLEEAFDIIKRDSLGDYKIVDGKKDAIKNLIKDNLELKNFKADFGYTDFLRTYPTLEGNFFLDEKFIGTSDVTNEPEDIRRYFARRGKKFALTIYYNSQKFVKNADVVEFSLTAPAGFFGMENDYKKVKVQ